MAAANTTKPALPHGKTNLWAHIVQNRGVYLVLLPGIIWYILFAYFPLFGLSLAFKTFKANLGIFHSPWVGLQNYVYVFRDKAFMESVGRTLYINILRLCITFPFPILLALAINEVRLGRTKKIFQTIYTFPNFLSWILVSSIMRHVFGQHGMVNGIITLFNHEPVMLLGSVHAFLPLIYITDIWKTAGWSAIIYLAAISGIDAEQYEAAEIDGATRLQRIWHISLPGIKGTIIVMFILAMGYLMSAGFDQLFNMSNAATSRVAETLDMYIYRITFQSASDFSFSSAVSLFRSIINFSLLITADRLAKKIGGQGLFG
ncbi:MAG: ABC transporter permease subunit [Syntrophomonadaceae bacterium]|jgi:putative aldouronate transport system permease protein|nr:ABC transporter permease subunit [Syntrophomonadaceae bacterium]